MPTTTSPIVAWLRQTTTVQGLAVLALTAVLQLTQAVDYKVVIGTAVTSLVLLILPGQGDLAGKLGKIAADAEAAAASRGGKAQIATLAADGMVLAGTLHPSTPVIPVAASTVPVAAIGDKPAA